MLDGIPFGSAGGIVCDRYREAECVAHLRLKFGLPDPGAATVAAACVRQDQQLGNTAPAPRSFAFPPGSDGVGGEGCGIVRDADADGAAVVRRVVNAVGDTDTAGIGGEVVIVHTSGPAIAKYYAEWRTKIIEEIGVRLDPKRLFDDAEKQIIFGRAQGKCELCSQPVDPADAEYDHS